jgi:hypothetical protein
MALLLLLRGLQLVVRRQIVGAGILPIGIEKELVELARKVVMVSHVAARSMGWIELGNPASRALHRSPQSWRPVIGVSPAHILAAKRGEIVDATILHGQRAVHVGFAGMELGSEEEFVVQGAVMQPNGACAPGFGALEDMAVAVRVYDGEGSLLDHPLQELREQHRMPPPCSRWSSREAV